MRHSPRSRRESQGGEVELFQWGGGKPAVKVPASAMELVMQHNHRQGAETESNPCAHVVVATHADHARVQAASSLQWAHAMDGKES
jgi:hypothetical protein